MAKCKRAVSLADLSQPRTRYILDKVLEAIIIADNAQGGVINTETGWYNDEYCEAYQDIIAIMQRDEPSWL